MNIIIVDMTPQVFEVEFVNYMPVMGDGVFFISINQIKSLSMFVVDIFIYWVAIYILLFVISVINCNGRKAI